MTISTIIRSKQLGNAISSVMITLAVVSISSSLLTMMSTQNVSKADQSTALTVALENTANVCLDQASEIIESNPAFFNKDFDRWYMGTANSTTDTGEYIIGQDQKTKSFRRPITISSAQDTASMPSMEKALFFATSPFGTAVPSGLTTTSTEIPLLTKTQKVEGRDITINCVLEHDDANKNWGLKRFSEEPLDDTIQLTVKAKITQTNQVIRQSKLIHDNSSISCDQSDTTKYKALNINNSVTTNQNFSVGKISGSYFQLGNQYVCTPYEGVNSTGGTSTPNGNLQCFRNADTASTNFLLVDGFRYNNPTSNAANDRIIWVFSSLEILNGTTSKIKINVYDGNNSKTAESATITGLVGSVNPNTVNRYIKTQFYRGDTESKLLVIIKPTTTTAGKLQYLTFTWNNSLSSDPVVSTIADVPSAALSSATSVNFWEFNPNNGILVSATTGASGKISASRVNWSTGSPVFGTALNNTANILSAPNSSTPTFTSAEKAPFAFTGLTNILQIMIPDDPKGIVVFSGVQSAHAGVYGFSLDPNKLLDANGEVSATGTYNIARLLDYRGPTATNINSWGVAVSDANLLYLFKNKNEVYWVTKTATSNTNTIADGKVIYTFPQYRWGRPADVSAINANGYVRAGGMSTAARYVGTFKNVLTINGSPLEQLWNDTSTTPPMVVFAQDKGFAIRDNNSMYWVSPNGYFKLSQTVAATPANITLLDDADGTGTDTVGQTMLFQYPYIYFSVKNTLTATATSEGGGIFRFSIESPKKTFTVGSNTRYYERVAAYDFGTSAQGDGNLFISNDMQTVSFVNITAATTAKVYTLPSCKGRQSQMGEYSTFEPMGYTRSNFHWVDNMGTYGQISARPPAF